MAQFIFIIFFIIEAAFVINFLITKPYQEKTKNLIHVNIFVFFNVHNFLSDPIAFSLVPVWIPDAKNLVLLTNKRATAFNIHIQGVGHLSLTDLSLTSPLLVNLLDRQNLSRDSTKSIAIINYLSLTFFDQFLK